MEIEAAKNRLREIYEGYGLEERPNADGELCFYDKRRDYLVFSVTAEEIAEYASVADRLPEVKIGPRRPFSRRTYMNNGLRHSIPFKTGFLGCPLVRDKSDLAMQRAARFTWK